MPLLNNDHIPNGNFMTDYIELDYQGIFGDGDDCVEGRCENCKCECNARVLTNEED